MSDNKPATDSVCTANSPILSNGSEVSETRRYDEGIRACIAIAQKRADEEWERADRGPKHEALALAHESLVKAFEALLARQRPSEADHTDELARLSEEVRQLRRAGREMLTIRALEGQRADRELAEPPWAQRLDKATPNNVEPGACCPTCGSPDPKRHPAVQHEGEVSICEDAFHHSKWPCFFCNSPRAHYVVRQGLSTLPACVDCDRRRPPGADDVAPAAHRPKALVTDEEHASLQRIVSDLLADLHAQGCIELTERSWSIVEIIEQVCHALDGEVPRTETALPKLDIDSVAEIGTRVSNDGRGFRRWVIVKVEVLDRHYLDLTKTLAAMASPEKGGAT